MKTEQTRSVRKASFALAAGVILLMGAGPTTVPVAAPSRAAAASPTTAPAVSASRATQESGYGRRERPGRSRYGGSTAAEASAAELAARRGDYSGTPSRSLFLKGNQDLTSRAAAPVVEAPRQPERQGPFTGTNDLLLVFNGAVIEDNEPAAFVEDVKTNLVGRVRPGDAVAGGVVTSVTLDELTFVVKGQTRHVHLGENFAGTAAITSSIAAAAPPTLTVNGVQVIGTGASIPIPVAAPGSGISKEDIEARMRARREQENKAIGTK